MAPVSVWPDVFAMDRNYNYYSIILRCELQLSKIISENERTNEVFHEHQQIRQQNYHMPS